MPKYALMIMMSFLGLATATPAVEQLTLEKERVEAFFSKLDASAKQKDVSSLVNAYATNALIAIRIDTPQGLHEQTLNLTQLEHMMRQTFEAADKYSMTRKITDMSIDPESRQIIVEAMEVEMTSGEDGVTVTSTANTYLLVPKAHSYEIIQHEIQFISENRYQPGGANDLL